MKEPDPVPEAVRSRLERLTETPALFLRDVDPVRRSAVLTPMTEDSYRASSFLDTRIQRAGDRELAIPLDTLQKLVSASHRPRRIIDYVFHVGHCGSSLLSRLLGQLPEFLALREPPLLMGLSRSYRRLDEPGFPISGQAWDDLLALSLAMLGRTWHAQQRALIKPTSHVANLIPLLMRFTGRERALLLYVDLETYLAAMLRKDMRRESQLYARDFRLRDFARLAPAFAVKESEPSDAQLAAMIWLLHGHEFSAALNDPAIEGRLLPVCFDAFLADPAMTLAAVCRFLRADQSSETIATLLAHRVVTRHAKSPDTIYDGSERVRELNMARVEYADEIRAGLDWAGRVSRNCKPFAGLTDQFSLTKAPPAPP